MKKRWNTYFKRAAVAGLSLCVLANSQLNVLATEVAGKAEEGIQSYGFWEDLFGKPEDEIETIDYIEIYREHLPVAVVGESFTDTDITLELYEDATYTAVGRWEDENGNRFVLVLFRNLEQFLNDVKEKCGLQAYDDFVSQKRTSEITMSVIYYPSLNKSKVHKIYIIYFTIHYF